MNVTFWMLYKQAFVLGEYQEWRDLCVRAARQGFTLTKIELALSLATLTNIVVLPVFVIAIALLIERLI